MEIKDKKFSSSAESFQKIFKGSNFIEGQIFKLEDVKLGFSFIKKREGNTASLFRVYIPDKEIEENTGSLKEIIASVSYGRKTEGGLAISSSDWKPSLSAPVSLVSRDDFFFDIDEYKIYTKDGHKISAEEMLTHLEDLHLKPTKKIRGFSFRIRYWFLKILLPGIFEFLYFAVVRLLGLFGRREVRSIWGLEEEKFHKLVDEKLDSIRQITFNNKQGNTIELLGYRVPVPIAFFYSLLQIILYFCFQKNEVFPPETIQVITNNILLALFYLVVTLTVFIFLMKLMQEALLYTVKYLSRTILWFKAKHLAFSFKSIKI